MLHKSLIPRVGNNRPQAVFDRDRAPRRRSNVLAGLKHRSYIIPVHVEGVAIRGAKLVKLAESIVINLC